MTAGHIDFVERGQQRGIVLGLDKPVGDGAAYFAHGHDLFLPAWRSASLLTGTLRRGFLRFGPVGRRAF